MQQIQANCSRFKSLGAFAAILEDGSVVTWGDAGFGGDSSAGAGLLKKMGQLQTQPAEMLLFVFSLEECHMEVAVDLVSMLFQIQH